MEMVGETEIDRGTEWEALAVAPPRTDFRGFSLIVDGLGVTWPVIQSTSGLCWNSQFIPKITSQEGSRLVITNKTLVGSMAESRMESRTTLVTQTEVVLFIKMTSQGVTRVFGRWRWEANLVSMKQSSVPESNSTQKGEEIEGEETERERTMKGKGIGYRFSTIGVGAAR